jgi:hypothetical protein
MQFKKEGQGSQDMTAWKGQLGNRDETTVPGQPWQNSGGTGHLGHDNRCDNRTGHPEQISLGRSAWQVSLGQDREYRTARTWLQGQVKNVRWAIDKSAWARQLWQESQDRAVREDSRDSAVRIGPGWDNRRRTVGIGHLGTGHHGQDNSDRTAEKGRAGHVSWTGHTRQGREKRTNRKNLFLMMSIFATNLEFSLNCLRKP